MRDESVYDVGYAAHAVNGFEKGLALVLKDRAGHRNHTIRGRDFDRARVRDVAAHLRAYALGQHIIGNRISPEARKHLAWNRCTPVCEIAGAGVHQLAGFSAGFDGLVPH